MKFSPEKLTALVAEFRFERWTGERAVREAFFRRFDRTLPHSTIAGWASGLFVPNVNALFQLAEILEVQILDLASDDD